MGRLLVKTGMKAEYEIARRTAARDVIVLSGVQTIENLNDHVPSDCEAIISFGLCGGLGPKAQIGQAFIYDRVVTPNNHTLFCDMQWRKRLFAMTRYYETRCWSSGDYNTANDPAQRAALFESSGCTVIDDESRAVAMFAEMRSLAFIGLRVVSDGAEDTLPEAVINALNPDGTPNLWEVIKSVIDDPDQLPALVKTAHEYEISVAELGTAARAIGPYFGWR